MSNNRPLLRSATLNSPSKCNKSNNIPSPKTRSILNLLQQLKPSAIRQRISSLPRCLRIMFTIQFVAGNIVLAYIVANAIVKKKLGSGGGNLGGNHAQSSDGGSGKGNTFLIKANDLGLLTDLGSTDHEKELEKISTLKPNNLNLNGADNAIQRAERWVEEEALYLMDNAHEVEQWIGQEAWKVCEKVLEAEEFIQKEVVAMADTVGERLLSLRGNPTHDGDDNTQGETTGGYHRHLAVSLDDDDQQQSQNDQQQQQQTTKILYIVTALAEYDTGNRGTKYGDDRLQRLLLPVLMDSLKSLQSNPLYKIDVYLILGWELKDERRALIMDALSIINDVGIEIWDDAIPLSYDKFSSDTISPCTRCLARQHRFVIKDKIDYYDVFMTWEDDMHITVDHVNHYLSLSAEIDKLVEEADDEELPPENKDNLRVPELQPPLEQHYYGKMSKRQLRRLVPGFFRVEVFGKDGVQDKNYVDPVPVDNAYKLNEDDNDDGDDGDDGDDVPDDDTDDNNNNKKEDFVVDPSTCCQLNSNGSMMKILQKDDMTNTKWKGNPQPNDIVLWEVKSLGVVVRELPSPKLKTSSVTTTNNGGNGNNTNDTLLDWVMLLPGPKETHPTKFIGGYWSGNDNYFGPNESKPSPVMPQLFGQQGGWMITRKQLIRMHEEECKCGYMPPYDEPCYRMDGLFMNNVEFWSGGFQFFGGGKAGCSMQRIVSLKPDHFSKHMVYHTSNNKQKGKSPVKSDRIIKANDFLGHVNTVRKNAIRKKKMALVN